MKKRREPEGLSADEMRTWLQDEIRDVLKECQLRLNDAVEFTTAYSRGELSPKAANARLEHYTDRWGEPLQGHFAKYESDEEIINAIDEKIAHFSPCPSDSMVSKIKRQSAPKRSRG